MALIPQKYQVKHAAVKKTEVGTGGGQIGGFPYLAKPVDMDELGRASSSICPSNRRGVARPSWVPLIRWLKRSIVLRSSHR